MVVKKRRPGSGEASRVWMVGSDPSAEAEAFAYVPLKVNPKLAIESASGYRRCRDCLIAGNSKSGR